MCPRRVRAGDFSVLTLMGGGLGATSDLMSCGNLGAQIVVPQEGQGPLMPASSRLTERYLPHFSQEKISGGLLSEVDNLTLRGWVI